MTNKILQVLKENGGWMSTVEIATALGVNLNDDNAFDAVSDAVAELSTPPIKIIMGLNSGAEIVRPDKGYGVFYKIG